MTDPMWLFIGDEILQGMFPYMRDPLAGRAIGDVIGSQGSTFNQWATCAGVPCENRSRTMLQIGVDDDHPPVVVIALGTNPAAGSDLPAGFLNDVHSAVMQAGVYGAQVVLIGPFGNDQDGKRLAALRSIIPDTIDGNVLASGLPRTSNGLFTPEGYKALAYNMINAVFQTLQARGAISTSDTTTTSSASSTPVPQALLLTQYHPDYNLTFLKTSASTKSEGSSTSTGSEEESGGSSETNKSGAASFFSMLPNWSWVAIGTVLGAVVIGVLYKKDQAKE